MTETNVPSVPTPLPPEGWSNPRPMTDEEKTWLIAEIKAGRISLS